MPDRPNRYPMTTGLTLGLALGHIMGVLAGATPLLAVAGLVWLAGSAWCLYAGTRP